MAKLHLREMEFSVVPVKRIVQHSSEFCRQALPLNANNILNTARVIVCANIIVICIFDEILLQAVKPSMKIAVFVPFKLPLYGAKLKLFLFWNR
jgi:hypothetical protein